MLRNRPHGGQERRSPKGQQMTDRLIRRTSPDHRLIRPTPVEAPLDLRPTSPPSRTAGSGRRERPRPRSEGCEAKVGPTGQVSVQRSNVVNAGQFNIYIYMYVLYVLGRSERSVWIFRNLGQHFT